MLSTKSCDHNSLPVKIVTKGFTHSVIDSCRSFTSKLSHCVKLLKCRNGNLASGVVRVYVCIAAFFIRTLKILEAGSGTSTAYCYEAIVHSCADHHIFVLVWIKHKQISSAKHGGASANFMFSNRLNVDKCIDVGWFWCRRNWRSDRWCSKVWQSYPCTFTYMLLYLTIIIWLYYCVKFITTV